MSTLVGNENLQIVLRPPGLQSQRYIVNYKSLFSHLFALTYIATDLAVHYTAVGKQLQRSKERT